MKKKLLCVIACLFMSVLSMYSTDTVELSCGKRITTVSMEYFTTDAADAEGAAEYMEFLAELDEHYCR